MFKYFNELFKRWFKKEIKRPLLIHEKYPEIIDWEVGEKIVTSWRDGVYMGVLDNQIVLKASNGQVLYIHAENKMSSVRNPESESRKWKEEEERVRLAIKNDTYSEFIKVLKEKKEATYEEWLPRLRQQLETS